MQDLNNENTVPTQPGRGSEDTVPNRVPREPIADMPGGFPSTEPTQVVQTFTAKPPKKPRGPRRWPWVILGVLLIALFAAAGGWFGYRSAIQLRKDKMEQSRVTTATEHFMLGIQAQTNKQYQIAQQQFEYVIKLDPSFPGAQDKLREVMIAMAIKASPTPAPTIAQPTASPTPDTRPQEEIFATAKAQFTAKDWNGLFATIDSLRQIDPKFHAVEIDDMLYVALRYRAIDKIIHQANLEGGLYDLALAEQFGPLDVDTLGYRNWARAYLNGASFWEIDWQKVVEAFEQIYPYIPNLRDSSGLTAIERYRIAARSYAEQLEAKGDSCGAFDYYKKSLDAVADGELEKTATAVYLVCHPPTKTPEPVTATPGVTVMPTDPGSVITPEPTKAAPKPTKEPKPTAQPTAKPQPTENTTPQK